MKRGIQKMLNQSQSRWSTRNTNAGNSRHYE
jgi:hypothetical protein